MRRAGLPHARRGPLLDGAEGPHRARQVPGRVGGDALLHRGAGGGRVQMGVDPRAEPRALRPADRLLDPDLHASRDRLSARDLRRLLPHGHAHRRLGGGLREVARAQGLEGARDRRRRPHGRRCDRDLQRGVRLGRGAGVEPLAATLGAVRGTLRRPLPVPRSGPRTDLADVVRGADVVVTVTPARGPDRPRRVDLARARTSPRSAPTRAATRSSTRASCSARASSSTTSASAAPTARSTSRSRRA